MNSMYILALTVGICALFVGSANAQECAALFKQCGGEKWTGPTCCSDGNECVMKSQWYSSCRRPGSSVPPTYASLPVPNEEINSCSTRWSQCGGKDWTGPQCCAGMNICVAQSEWYSQCKPTPLASSFAQGGAQCGGANWQGPIECEDLFECVEVNKWYSVCKYITEPTRRAALTVIPPIYGGAECSPLFGQCGGKKWTGATCCADGNECVQESIWHSYCRRPGSSMNPPTYAPMPVPNEVINDCSARWSQCGGATWTGPTCCAGNNECVEQNKWYSQCKPLPLEAGIAEGGAQCGGWKWEHATVCEELFTCVEVNKWYSQCQYITPPTRVTRSVQTIIPPVYTAPEVCSPMFGQCGGKKWTGPTCCSEGECIEKNQWYSSCRRPGDKWEPATYGGKPLPNMETNGCAMRWSKCGGQDWTGPTCCAGDDECVEESKWYSQCKPTPRAEGVAVAEAQCGGANWKGPTVCEKLYKCVDVNEWYSQCQLDVVPTEAPPS